MSDINYSMGLDAGGFLAAATRCVTVMGSLQLACELLGKSFSLATSAFVQAGDMESTTVGIDTITKSLTKTAQVMADLKKLGAETPFEMKDLAPAAKQLLGAGTATKDVAKQLKVLGDIAAGAGANIMPLVTVFNQIRGAGKLMTQDFMQLVQQGVPGLRQEIAKFKGIDLTEVAKALEEGAISAADLEAIFGKMTSSGGVFFNAMQKQSETFNGKLSNLADAWNTLLVAFAAPINNALKPVIDDIGNLVTFLTPAFGAVGSEIGRVVTAAREFVLQLNAGHDGVTALKSAFGRLFGDLGDLVAIPFNAILATLHPIGNALMSALTPVGDWLGARLEQAAHKFVALLQSGLAGIADAIPGLGSAVPVLRSMAKESDQQSRNAGYGAKAVDFTSGFNNAGDSLGDALLNFRGVFTQGINKFLPEKKVIGPPTYVPGTYAPLPNFQFGAPRLNEALSRPEAERMRDQTSNSNAVQQAVQQILSKLEAIVTPLTALSVV